MSELRAGTPISVAGITLIPIERLWMHAEKQPHAVWLSASKAAVAVVICDPQGPRAVDVHAHEQSVEALVTEIPALATLLTEFYPHRK